MVPLVEIYNINLKKLLNWKKKEKTLFFFLLVIVKSVGKKMYRKLLFLCF